MKEIEQKYPKKLIKKLYLENKLSKEKIAKELNISVSIVNKILKYYNLKRDRYKILSEKLSNPNSKKQSHFQELCKRIPKEDIIKWYVEEDHKYEDAFEHYGITQFAFDKLCKYYGIKKDRKKTSLKSVETRFFNAGGREEYNRKINKIKKDNIINRYGSLEEFENKRRKNIKKVWCDKHEEMLMKIYKTKTEHNSFNSSKVEEKYFSYLKNKYGEKDIIRQYKDSRYPFYCDFYIKSLDIFIELNLHWSHGGKLFKGDNGDLNKLKIWEEKAKSSLFYKNAIITWTKRDVEKYNYIINNKLNFKIYYRKEELPINLD